MFDNATDMTTIVHEEGAPLMDKSKRNLLGQLRMLGDENDAMRRELKAFERKERAWRSTVGGLATVARGVMRLCAAYAEDIL